MPTAEKFAIIKTAAVKARRGHAGIAQLVVQLICNQQVGGSSPSAGSKGKEIPALRQTAQGGDLLFIRAKHSKQRRDAAAGKAGAL